MKIKLILVLALVLLSSCRSAQKETCQKDSDCDNKVCVFGKCQECAQIRTVKIIKHAIIISALNLFQ